MNLNDLDFFATKEDNKFVDLVLFVAKVGGTIRFRGENYGASSSPFQFIDFSVKIPASAHGNKSGLDIHFRHLDSIREVEQMRFQDIALNYMAFRALEGIKLQMNKPPIDETDRRSCSQF